MSLVGRERFGKSFPVFCTTERERESETERVRERGREQGRERKAEIAIAKERVGANVDLSHVSYDQNSFPLSLGPLNLKPQAKAP